MRISTAPIGWVVALLVLSAHADEPSTSTSASTGTNARTSTDTGTSASTSIKATPAYEHYQMIQDWLRENGLLARTYEAIVNRAATSEAAAKYVQCHETTKSPAGEKSRLELLASCLRAPVPADPVAVADASQ